MTQQNIAGTTGTVSGSGELVAYTVPGSVTVTPYSVAVVANGNGASGAFLPCLSFYSQAGNLIARSPAPEVAQGDVALVSWFPHVAQQSAPTPPPVSGGIQWAYLSSGGTNTTCNAGTSTILKSDATTFYTNASSLYDVHTTAGVAGIRLLAVGHYLVWVSARAEVTPTAGDSFDVVAVGGGLVPDFSASTFSLVFPTGGATDAGDVTNGVVMCAGGFEPVPTAPIKGQFDNFSAHNLTFELAGIVVIQLDDVNEDLN